jgi:putative phage-type endonuclease
MIERIPITSREQWLALRKQDITASICGALFGVHPYTSALALYQEKCGLELPEKTNVRMRRGSRLERAVAEEVAEQRKDWTITPAREYLRDPGLRLGASPDFYVANDPRGRGVLQTKVATAGAFKKHWRDGDDLRPPFWIGLQTLTEMLLADAAWGAVAVYIDDPWNDDCHICEVPRHAGAEARIREAVKKFWDDVAAGREPSPDYGRDAELFAALYPEAKPLKTVDLTGSNHLPTLLAERADLKAQIAKAEARVKEIDTEVKFAMGDAEIATLPGFSITLKTQSRKAYEVKATSFRRLNISDNRPQGAEDDSSGPF